MTRPRRFLSHAMMHATRSRHVIDTHAMACDILLLQIEVHQSQEACSEGDVLRFMGETEKITSDFILIHGDVVPNSINSVACICVGPFKRCVHDLMMVSD